MLAIMEALWHWQLHLDGKKFIVCIDHQKLMYFFAKPNIYSCQLCQAENIPVFLP